MAHDRAGGRLPVGPGPGLRQAGQVRHGTAAALPVAIGLHPDAGRLLDAVAKAGKLLPTVPRARDG